MAKLKADVFNTAKEKVGSISLDESVFGAEIKEHLFYDAVRYQMAKRRQGSHQTKGRTQVSGGGKKPFKQKGTGRARQGTIRAVQMRGGGVVFGPHNRDHSHKMPKKVRRAAIKAALSRRTEEKALTVFENFEMDAIKTKAFKAVMDNFGFEDLLLVLDSPNDVVSRSARNLPGVTVIPVTGLNVYDILNHKNLALTSSAVDGIVARLGN
jgi:large subunit ribosomal protein L4